MTTLIPDTSIINHHLDTQGLICPEPVMMLHKTIRRANGGEVIEILATDPATTRDIPNFCRHLGHELLHHELLDKEKLADSAVSNSSSNEENDSDTDLPINGSTYRYLVKKKSA